MRKAFGHVSELLKGLAGRLHLPDAPSGCPKRSEGGSPATARRTCVRCTPYKCRLGGASKRLRRRQPPPPPVRYAGIAHPSLALYGTGAECFTCGRRDGTLRRDIRVPEAKRGRVPCRNKEERRPSANQENKNLNTKALSSKAKGFICARYWDRTSDLFRVREARYRCANRAHKTVVLLRGEDGIRTRVHGFAGRCLTTRPPHRIRSPRGTRSNSWSPYERLTRLELATSTLARWCSTN